jgi:hypothetical protein
VHPRDLTIAMVALSAGLDPERLDDLASKYEDHFLPARWKWVGRKRRIIDEPNYHLMRIQRRLLGGFHRWNLHHPSAYAGPKHVCHLDAARKHTGARWVLMRDLHNAYPSVTPAIMLREFARRGFKPDVASLLTKLLTVRGRIPQGAPLSNIALNLVLFDLDHQMASFCGHLGLRYTRYADDMTISCPLDHPKALVDVTGVAMKLTAILKGLNLEISVRKARKKGFTGPGCPKLVHGCHVEVPGRITQNEDQVSGMVALAESYLGSVLAATPESLLALEAKRKKLFGAISFARCFDDQSGADHAHRLLIAGDRRMTNRLHTLGIRPLKNEWWRGLPSSNEVGFLAHVWRKTLRTRAGVAMGTV